MALSTIPAAFGNPGPLYRMVLTIPPGPRRVTDAGAEPPFHVASGESLRRARQPVRLAACRKILLAKLDFIGDWVLTTPLLENLRRAAPHAEITVVVLDRAFDLASACPFVDRVVSLSSAGGFRAWFGASSPAVLGAFRRDYLGAAFDLALVPRWDIDFNGALQLAYGSGAPRVIGFAERSTERKADFNRGEDRFMTDVVVDDRDVHEVEHNLRFLDAIGGTVATRRATADVFDADIDHARAFREAAFPGSDRPLLAVAPFVEDQRRQYPTDRLASVVRRLQKAFDLDVVVLGGPAQADAAEAVASAIGGDAVSAAGRLSVRQAAALIGEAGVLIGMDSGPAHLAAAAGTPVAVLSCHPADGSPRHPHSPVRFAPWGAKDKVLILQPAHARKPCRDGCDGPGPHCILELTEARVWPELSAFVGRAMGKAAKG